MIDKKDSRFKAILGDAEPSDAQLKIINFAVHGIGNAVVQSRAGSGKSKTIELAVAFIPPTKNVLVVSYNRHIAQHLRSKFSNLDNVTVKTYHSLGRSILTTKFKNFKDSKLNEEKYKTYITQNIEELSDKQWQFFDGVQRWCYKKNLEKLVDYARYNKAQSVKELIKVCKKYRIETIHNEPEAVRKILQWGSEHIETFDFTDLIWLPYELNITGNMKCHQYDMIFIDEAQDSSLIQQSLLEICKKRNTRFLAFGDAKQTINSWCGSDENAFANFNKQPNTQKFALNMSYRCGKRIAQEVQKLVPDFSVPDSAPVGSVNYMMTTSSVKEGDLILSRMTSPLIKLHMQFLKDNKPSKVCGLKLSHELISTIESTHKENMTEVIDELNKNLVKLWGRLATQYECSLKDVASEALLIELYDEIQSISAISQDTDDKDEVIKRIKEIFSTDIDEEGRNVDVLDDKHIHLSTVHRAKGLEANNVFILCPSQMPSNLATEEWEKQAEENLIYVAWSRARNSLNFLDEKENRPPKSYCGVNEFYNELIELKNKYGNLTEEN